MNPPAEWDTRRRMQLVLSSYASAVFAVLWFGLLVVLVSDASLADDAWEWLQGLPALPQVVAWILALPIAVGLWAWQAGLSDLVRMLVGLGLVAWTLVAFTNLTKAIWGTGGSR